MVKKAIVYIICPSEYSTGGVECLHQLSHKLLDRDIDARMFYTPSIKGEKMEKYARYSVSKTEKIIDDEKNIVIFPEVLVDKISRYKNVRKAIWWLSVDNAKRNTTLPIGKMNRNIPWLKNRFPKVYDYLKKTYIQFNSKGKILFDFKKNSDIMHIAQSFYAKDFLENHGVKKVFMIRDYLNKEFFSKIHLHKEDMVIFNPQKGIEITKKLMRQGTGIRFVPIQNMTPKEVSELFAKAKVYIDFGSHPGRDKMPREAVVRNCCIIVGKAGSANFIKDIPIKEEYRFDNKNLDVTMVIHKIKQCFREYNERIADFKVYKREVIRGEKNIEKEIGEFLKHVKV